MKSCRDYGKTTCSCHWPASRHTSVNRTSGHAVAANFTVRMPRATFFICFGPLVSQQFIRPSIHAIRSGRYQAPLAKRNRIACARNFTPGKNASWCNRQSASSFVGGFSPCRIRFFSLNVMRPVFWFTVRTGGWTPYRCGLRRRNDSFGLFGKPPLIAVSSRPLRHPAAG